MGEFVFPRRAASAASTHTIRNSLTESAMITFTELRREKVTEQMYLLL